MRESWLGNTHNYLHIALAGTLLLACVGCTTMRSGAHQADYASFDDYRSFAWIAPDPWIVTDASSASVSPLTRRKITDALRAEFEKAGYSFREDNTDADFVIAYTIGTREEIDLSSYPVIYRNDWNWYPYSRAYPHAGYRRHSYTEGTLGVDVFDAGSQQPVWHGWARKRILDADIENPTPTIREAVAQIVSHFPKAR